MVMGDQIKERQKIQRFNLTNGGAVEVNGAESGNVYIEAFDEDNPLCGTVLEPTPAECDALIAAIGRALGRPAPTSTPLEERIAKAIQANIYERDAPTTEREEAVHLDGYAKGLREALAMVREQGATVPRAGVAAILPLLAGVSNMLDASDDAEAKREAVRRIDRIVVAIGRMTTDTTPPEKG